jgi:predicted nucleotidyltransferase
MLLTHTFDDPELNLALEVFLCAIRDILGERLVSVVLHGSVAFDELAPGYGDLDFVAVIEDDLREDDCAALVEARKPLRSGDHGVLCRMIEGAFIPRKMLDPAIRGDAFWWGTSGERRWAQNELGTLVNQVIRERGIVVFGEDVRGEIPAPSEQVLLAEIGLACEDAQRRGRGGSVHSVDWLLTMARLLLWVRECRLSSKSEAAEWAYRHAQGNWREFLPQAKQIRRNPALADAPEVKAWLETLTGPIQDACGEVESAVAKRRGK